MSLGTLRSEVQVCLGLKGKNGMFGGTNLCIECFLVIRTFTQQFSAMEKLCQHCKKKSKYA